MAYNDEVFKDQYPAVVFFVQRLAYRRALFEADKSLTHNREFWVSVSDGHLKLAAIAWCMVFGTYNENLHWTKTPTNGNAEMAKQDFRDRLLSKTGFTPEEWDTYHKNMLDFRNKYVVHVDLTQKFSSSIPNFDPALQAAYAYDEWVKALIRTSWGNSTPVIWDNPALILIYEQCKAAAFSVINSITPEG